MTDFRLLETGSLRATEDPAILRGLESLPGGLLSVSDPFTYANGNLTTVGSANWVGITGYSSPVVASNVLDSGGAEVAAQWNGSFSPNQYAEADFISGTYPGVLVRSHTNATWVRLGVGQSGSDRFFEWYHHSSGGSWTSFGPQYPLGATTTGKMRAEVVKNTYSCYLDGVLKGRWMLDDSNALTDGTPGVYIWTGGTLDNFAAGELDDWTYPRADDFNRATTTAPSAGGVGLGPDWYAPDFRIETNTAYRINSGANDYATYLIDLGSDDQWVEADLYNQGGGNYVCLNTRHLGPGSLGANSYIVFYDGTNIEIGRNTSGSYATISTTAYSGPINEKMRVECEGTAIRVYMSGTLRASTTSSVHPNGHFVGMNCNPTVTGYYDNFRCGPLPYVP